MFRWLAGALRPAHAPAFAQDKKPNVVFILAHNVGPRDVGVYAGGVHFA